MTRRRAVVTASVLGLHPHRRLLVLAGVISVALVQVLIIAAARANSFELTLFAIALLVLMIEPAGIGSYLMSGITVLGWVWTGGNGVDVATLMAALLLLLTFACLNLVAHGHPQAPVGPVLARRWVRDTAVIATFTVVVWCVALLVTRVHIASGSYLSIVGLGGLAGLAFWWRRQLTAAGAKD